MYQYGSFSYSIDKIKLKGRLDKYKSARTKYPHQNKIRVWCECFLPPWIECIKAVDNCFKLLNYRFYYTLRVKGETEGIFQIGEWYNGDYQQQRECPEQFIIEYNPNKAGSKIYKAFCYTFIFNITEIISFDLAYDIPGAKATDVLIDTKCDVMTYGKTFNKTLYIAPKEDGSGRVKIYSKDEERALQGIKISELLRIEVTIKGYILAYKGQIILNNNIADTIVKVVNHLNSVKMKRKTTDNEDWKVFALSCLSPEQLQKCFGMMGKEARAKYRKVITESSYYTLDLDVTTLSLHILTALSPWQERMKI